MYEKVVIPKDVDRTRVVAIDIGVENLATLTTNIGEKPIIVKGKILKSVNQFYNKVRADLQKLYSKEGIFDSRRLRRLTQKRNNQVKDYLHKASRGIIDYCVLHRIGTIVIGKNDYWKQSVDLGKKINQQFVCIPHSRFIDMLKYKAHEVGIEVLLTSEEYTSLCSLLDFESIERHTKYAGKRVSRGLFKSKEKIVINADVNGSGNILRKALPNALCADGMHDGVGPFVCSELGVDRSEYT